MQRSLVSMLDQMLAPDDLFAVMTPHMSPSDLAFARKTETVEGYLRRYWTWGQRDRMMPDGPDGAAVHRVLSGPPPGQLISPLAQELIDRRREKFALDALQDLSLYLRGLREERKAVIAVTIGWLLPRDEPRPVRARSRHQARLARRQSGRLTTDRMKSDYGYSIADCETRSPDPGLHRSLPGVPGPHRRRQPQQRQHLPRGLARAGRVSDTPIGSGRERSPAGEIQRVRRRVEGLRTLAVDTDGIAVIDTNDIDSGLKRIVADMSSYYLVGYYTKNAKLDGRFRKITRAREAAGRRRAGASRLQGGDGGGTGAAEGDCGQAEPGRHGAVHDGAVGHHRPAGRRPSRTSVAFARRGSEVAGPVRMWTAVELDAVVDQRATSPPAATSP